MKSVNGTNEAARPLIVGTVNGANIVVDATILGHAAFVYVTLKSGCPYAMLSPPAWPARPHLTGKAHSSGISNTQTIPAGTRLSLLPVEAAALVAAGVAVYS